MITNFNTFNPSFKSEYVADSHVLVKNSSGEYEPLETSIVKLDVTDKNDMKVLKTITKDWAKEYKKYNYGEHYSSAILWTAKQEKKHIQNKGYTNTQFYMMTTQDDDFKNLNPKNVLAEVEIFNSDACENILVDYLQVRPKYKFNGTKDRPVKKIGENFIKDLTNKVVNKKGSLFSDQFSCEFYRAIGAEEDDEERFAFVV